MPLGKSRTDSSNENLPEQMDQIAREVAERRKVRRQEQIKEQQLQEGALARSHEAFHSNDGQLWENHEAAKEISKRICEQSKSTLNSNEIYIAAFDELTAMTHDRDSDFDTSANSKILVQEALVQRAYGKSLSSDSNNVLMGGSASKPDPLLPAPDLTSFANSRDKKAYETLYGHASPRTQQEVHAVAREYGTDSHGSRIAINSLLLMDVNIRGYAYFNNTTQPVPDKPTLSSKLPSASKRGQGVGREREWQNESANAQISKTNDENGSKPEQQSYYVRKDQRGFAPDPRADAADERKRKAIETVEKRVAKDRAQRQTLTRGYELGR